MKLLLIVALTMLPACQAHDPCAGKVYERVTYDGVRGFTGPELPNSSVMFHTGQEHGPQCVVKRCEALVAVGKGNGY